MGWQWQGAVVHDLEAGVKVSEGCQKPDFILSLNYPLIHYYITRIVGTSSNGITRE